MANLETFELFPSRPAICPGKRTCISLCSGILGLELGLWRAGFAIRLAIDTDERAKKTAVLNFPELNYSIKDVAKVSASFVLDQIGAKQGEIDLLAGGLPCQAFSKSGLRKGLKDSRGRLFKHYIRLLKDLRPKAFIVENVKGILSTRKGKDFKEILNKFHETGYTIYWKVLNAANYGVPQFRQRLFLLGFEEQIKFSFPDITHENIKKGKSGLKSFITVEDAIGDLRNVKDYPSYRGKYAHLLPEIPEGLNYSYYTKKRGHPDPIFGWRSKFWFFLLKLDRKRPSLTIQAYPGNNTGPFHWENRKLAVSELKRLQTIPDWFEMGGSYATKHRHIGNAVPPLLAYKIGVQINEALTKKDRITQHEYLAIMEKMGPSSEKFQVNYPETYPIPITPTGGKRIS